MTSSDDAKRGARPWFHVLLVGLILGAVLAWALVNFGMLHLTHPVLVWVDADVPDAQMSMMTVNSAGVVEPTKVEGRFEGGPIGAFETQRFPYRGIVLIAAPATFERVSHVTMHMSVHHFEFDAARFQKEWTRWEGELPRGTEGRVYQTSFSSRGSFIDILDHAVNYEGDAALAKYVFLSPIFVVFALCFMAMISLRAFVGASRDWSPLVREDAVAPQSSRAWPWLLAGLAILIGVGVMLELRHPYYFTQDDNFAQFLPNIVYGCESMRAGVFPNWNPHQYLGAPLAEIGTYALTYPGTYIAYGIAAFLLGDANATIDVFCCMHLLLGYFAVFWLGRRLELAAPLASAFSLCQVLSGFALIGGRSWYYMTPLYVWVPLLFVALLHARTRAPTLRWTLATGLVIGLFFHAGNAQMWVYALGLAGLFAVWSCCNRSMPWTRFPQMVPAGLIGLGIAAVLLVPQFLATRDLERTGGAGWDLGEGALAIFAPYPTPVVPYPEDRRKYADPEHFGALYYAGTVLSAAWVAGLLFVGIWRGTVRSFVANPWNGLAILTFVLALGHLLRLWTWQAQLPVFNQFNHPAKFLPFFHLFSCAVGAMFLNRVIVRSSTPDRWRMVTFIVIAALLLYNARNASSALFVYAERPYPALPSELTDLTSARPQPVRILPLTYLRSTADEYVIGLQHHFPTVYGISSVGGYDPIIEKDAHYRSVMKELKADARAALRKHGVTHLILHDEVADSLRRRDWTTEECCKLPASFSALVVECERSKPMMQSHRVRVYEVLDTTPLAHAASKALPVRLSVSRVDVDVARATPDHDVVLNFLWRPGIRVYADGKLVPASADAEQHIRVPIRAGTKNLTLQYESPWRLGLLLGGVLVVVGLFGGFVSNRWIGSTRAM